MTSDWLSLVVPDEITAHFVYEGHEQIQGVYRIYLVEKDDIEHVPKQIVHQGKAVLNGYMNPIELQTYPLKGKEVFLYLKRRRWKLKGGNISHMNEYNFHRKGMKATREFGDFLKEIGRG